MKLTQKHGLTKRVANGFTYAHMPLNRAVNICFDEETFTEIKTFAGECKTSMSGAVRELVEIGLETLKMEEGR